MSNRLNLRLSLLVGLIMACFAANSVITRYLVLASRVPPYLVTAGRFESGFLLLLVLTLARPTRFKRESFEARNLVGGAFLGVYAFSISYGYLFISVAAGTFVFYTLVVITMTIYSIIVAKERLSLQSATGQLLGLLGVLVITFGGIRSVTLLGVLLMAATGTSWGLYSAYGKRFDAAFSYTFNSFLSFGAFTALLLLALALFGKLSLVDISRQNIGLLLYMGVISTALSYVLWNKTMTQIPASLGGLVQLAVPILSPAMGILLLGESITAALLLGATLVLIGIYLATAPSIRKKP